MMNRETRLRELVRRWRVYADKAECHIGDQDMRVENETHMRDMRMCADELEAELTREPEPLSERQDCGHLICNLIGDEYGHFECDACKVAPLLAEPATADKADAPSVCSTHGTPLTGDGLCFWCEHPEPLQDDHEKLRPARTAPEPSEQPTMEQVHFAKRLHDAYRYSGHDVAAKMVAARDAALRSSAQCGCHPAQCRDEQLWRDEIEKARSSARLTGADVLHAMRLRYPQAIFSQDELERDADAFNAILASKEAGDTPVDAHDLDPAIVKRQMDEENEALSKVATLAGDTPEKAWDRATDRVLVEIADSSTPMGGWIVSAKALSASICERLRGHYSPPQRAAKDEEKR